MTDHKINRKLALAIGYAHQQVRSMSDGSMIVMHTPGMWHKFSYMDWRVAGPIAQRYNCFPSLTIDAKWRARGIGGGSGAVVDTPQLAIALVVISARERGMML